MIKSPVAKNGNTSLSAILSMVKAYLSFLLYDSGINMDLPKSQCDKDTALLIPIACGQHPGITSLID